MILKATVAVQELTYLLKSLRQAERVSLAASEDSELEVASSLRSPRQRDILRAQGFTYTIHTFVSKHLRRITFCALMYFTKIVLKVLMVGPVLNSIYYLY